MTIRIGSLCTGFGGLDHAITDALGPAELVFVADPGSRIDKDRIDDGPVRLLAHRYPDVPNLGDISATDWAAVPDIDVLAAGFPCQDLSHAGRKAGLMPGTRSGIWSSVVACIAAKRPSLVFIENVGGLLSARAYSDLEPCPWCMGDEPGGGGERIVLRALGRVLGDLADLGFDAQWTTVRARDVGAPHDRKRVFVIAWPADAAIDTGRLVNRNRDTAGHGRVGAGGERLTLLPTPLLPTPNAALGRGTGLATPEYAARRAGQRHHFGLDDAVALLPTPTASDGTGAGHAARGGRNLRTEIALLPTPKSSDSKRGDSASERRRKSPDLSTVMALLSTPRASDGDDGGPGQRGSSGDLMLPSAVALLTTPTATPYGRQRSQSEGAALRPSLDMLAGRLLPTPTAALADGGQTSRGGDRSSEALLGDASWGKFAAAISRWQYTVGRPAPAPTTLSRRDRPQLNAVFVEWLMGCDEGWVTGVPGLTRNQQLRLLGNGVVRQQGAHALRRLLADAGFTDTTAMATS